MLKLPYCGHSVNLNSVQPRKPKPSYLTPQPKKPNLYPNIYPNPYNPIPNTAERM